MNARTRVERLFKAILPDDRANEFAPIRKVIRVVMDRIGEAGARPEVSGVMAQIEQLLDESVAANAYLIGSEERQVAHGPQRGRLGQRQGDVRERPATHRSAEKLRSMLTARSHQADPAEPHAGRPLRALPAAARAVQRGQLERRSSTSTNSCQFSQSLTEEETRAVSAGLSEEQLAVFDLLTRPGPELSADEEQQVKRVAEELLAVLKREKLVLDWRKEQRTRAAVRVTVEETLDRLPEKYTRQIYAQKCDAVYQHVFESYFDDGHSVYDLAA